MTTFSTAEEALQSLDGTTHENYFKNSATPANPIGAPWSKSSLKRLVHTPEDWFAGIPFKSTAKMAFGSLVDDYLFWGNKFRDEYALTSECPWNKNPGKQEATAIRKQGKIPMKPSEMDKLKQIEQQLLLSQDGRQMLAGHNQVPLLGAVTIEYEVEGVKKEIHVPVKGLLDGLFIDGATGSTIIYDMKVTSARDVADVWSIFTGLCYHWQDELYTQLAVACGLNPDGFRFVFVQDEAPFRLQVVEIDDNLRANAKVALNEAWATVAALAEGWCLNDLFPEVMTFGTNNPWSRFAGATDSVKEKITNVNVHYRGKPF